MKIFLIAAALVLVGTPAMAEDWNAPAVNTANTVKAQLSNDFAIPVSCAAFACGDRAVYYPFTAQVYLSEFARSSTLNALSARLSRGVAMSSALALDSPMAGKQNRVGMGFSRFAGATAASINYTHRSGSYDMGLAASFTDGDTLGKASVGFSW